MKKLLTLFLSLALGLLPSISVSLVNPKPSLYAKPEWMAEIFVVSQNNTHYSYCKGTLVAPDWILSSSSCYYDPFKAKKNAANIDDPEFVIRLGTSNEYLANNYSIDNKDFTLTLWHLTKAVTNQPLKLSKKSVKDLENQNVLLLGTESTESIYHSYYNPSSTGRTTTCEINGELFFTDDAFCYVLNKSKSAISLLETQAIVIDPSTPGAPDTKYDTYKPFDKTGARLYLDFRASGSYACHEDLGSPVLWVNADGQLEQVGVVADVGMTLGIPVCGPALRNVFSSIANYQSFIDDTLASYAFNSLCPAQPKLNVTYLENNRVRLSWQPIANAKGYKILYSTDEGFIPFKAIDVKNVTEITTTLSATNYYSASLSAYNDNCASVMSNLIPVYL